MAILEIKSPTGLRTVGKGLPVFIIGEVSANHNGNLDRAKRIIDAIADAGADAVKIQTYTADTMTIDANNEYFIVNTDNEWNGKTLHELYEWAYTPWEWQAELKSHAEKRGLIFFSTAYDESSVEFLEGLNIPLYKVASFESEDIPLLKAIGATGKPVIMSRGMTSKDAVQKSVDTLRKSGCPSIAVLHCVSAYPALPEDMNILTIPDIASSFDVVPGLSDHTLDNEIAVAAVALGAKIVEKHVTLRRADGGPDAAFSLEPEEFTKLVDSIRNVEAAMGKPSYELTKSEESMAVFKRSIFVAQDMKKGEKFTPENCRVIRPGYGMVPDAYEGILKMKATKDLRKGTPLTPDLVTP